MAKPKISLHQDIQKIRKRRDALILRRAKNGDSHEAIAADLGMTRQRVGQIIAAAKPKETT